jgi:hypothetical protein
MRVKLSDAAIRSYVPRTAQYSVGDAACPGMCIRITPKGIKTFACAYRDKGTGKVAWLTVGRYPDVPLTKAREVVNDARKTVAAGFRSRPRSSAPRLKTKLRPTPTSSPSITTPS